MYPKASKGITGISRARALIEWVLCLTILRISGRAVVNHELPVQDLDAEVVIRGSLGRNLARTELRGAAGFQIAHALAAHFSEAPEAAY